MRNTERFEQVIEEFGPSISRIAASFEADPSLREDLIQDIGLAVWSSISSYSGRGSFKGFVLRIAHNKAVDHVAKEVTRSKHTVSTEDEAGSTAPLETNVQLSQEQIRLITAIRQMSLPLKEVTTLLLEDMSYKEIADILGISVSNVGVRVNRAKEWLKEKLV